MHLNMNKYKLSGSCILLCSRKDVDSLSKIINFLQIEEYFLFAHSISDIFSIKKNLDISNSNLVAFNTGVVVPESILKIFQRPSFNFHAAPPEYPGRDPHHWAVYDGAVEYGVTAHVMVKKVDAGAIVAVSKFQIDSQISPQELRALAKKHLLELFQASISKMIFGSIVAEWGRPIRKRRDLEKLCDLRNVNEKERLRRRRAFEGFKFIE